MYISLKLSLLSMRTHYKREQTNKDDHVNYGSIQWKLDATKYCKFNSYIVVQL